MQGQHVMRCDAERRDAGAPCDAMRLHVTLPVWLHGEHPSRSETLSLFVVIVFRMSYLQDKHSVLIFVVYRAMLQNVVVVFCLFVCLFVFLSGELCYWLL